MTLRWLSRVALVAPLVAACSPAPEPPAASAIAQAPSAGAGVTSARAGASALPPPTPAGATTVGVPSINSAAAGVAGAGGRAAPAMRPVMAQGAAGSAPAMPPPTAAAGAAAPRVPAARSTGCGQPNMMTGVFQAQIRAFELDRGYYMSVPKDYDPERAYRLVFGFHGSGYTGKMMRGYLDNEKAPLLDGTIFVYPDGLPVGNDPANTAWELKANGRDSAFFDALLDQLRATYCIDETRIFVNGQSFGALMTNFVGCLRGDMIRAIAAVAGSGPRGSMCTGKVAVWLTHGTDDMSVTFKSGEASRDFWVSANGCSTMTVPGTPAQCLVYQGCDPEHGVTWCPHTDDGGHQHPSFGRAAVREFLAAF